MTTTCDLDALPKQGTGDRIDTLALSLFATDVAGGSSILLYTSSPVVETTKSDKLVSSCQLMALAISQRLGKEGLVKSIKYATGPFRNGRKHGWILIVDVEKSQAHSIGLMILKILPEMLDFVGVTWTDEPRELQVMFVEYAAFEPVAIPVAQGHVVA